MFHFSLMIFFPFEIFNFFLQQHENTIKNNNKKNNYIYQLKHTQKKIIQIIEKNLKNAIPTYLPKG